jgi:hypothetical protein
MARRNGGDNFQYGVCTNTDFDGNGNPCPKCANKEVQKIRGSKEFVCEECGESLTKVKGGNDPWWKKPIVLIVAAVLLVAGIGYGIYAAVSGMGGSKIKGIKLDKKELTLKVGERDLLTATPDPTDAKATFIWKSSDKSVVDVVGGELTALKKGKATITVKVEENAELRAVTCKVEVKEAKSDDTDEEKESETKETLITSLSINSSDFTLKIGESKTLAYQATPEKNDENVSWSTSDPKVATVSASGEVKAVGAGTATITALSDKSAKDASVKVTVEKKKEKIGDSGNGWGKENLGYGIYEGERRNHKPHGHGTIRYTKSHQIVSWKDYMASPGDTFEGNFRDGKISGLGYWKHNGNVTAIQ